MVAEITTAGLLDKNTSAADTTMRKRAWQSAKPNRMQLDVHTRERIMIVGITQNLLLEGVENISTSA